MNILGIVASSVFKVTGSYESIATVTVGGGGSATITFSSIPATYTHLQIRYIARDSRTNTNSDFTLRFNSDTANNYNTHDLASNGSVASTGGATNSSSILIANMSGNTATANTFGAGIVDILDYINTNKYKTVRSLGGHDNNGNGFVMLTSGAWRNTVAVTSITLIPLVANFRQYSSFALYGIK